MKQKLDYDGVLYVCGTPIGNLDDITLRAMKTLASVDLIASEDTRVTRKLLEKYEIKTPQVCYNRHNSLKKSGELVSLLLSGKNIALVSDAGMPGISDPGETLIAECIKGNIKVVVIPGVSSVTTSVVQAGFPIRRFVFEGFLPRDGKTRRKRLREIKDEVRTLILYSSPHRIHHELDDLLLILGNRKIFFGRELTKKFEECRRCKLEDLIEYIKGKEVLGEITLVLEGREAEELEADVSDAELELLFFQLSASGIYGKKAVKEVASATGMSNSDLYRFYISIKDKLDKNCTLQQNDL